MDKITKLVHILEERDGEYFDRVVCSSRAEAEEIIREVGGNFRIVGASEVNDYLHKEIDFNNLLY